MARDKHQDVQREMRQALRLEPFYRGGTSRLVKVLPLGVTTPRRIGGYVTQEAFLVGLTPTQIEQALGLETDSLTLGCRIFRLIRPPGPSEVEYELTTQYPDGLAYSPTSDPKYPPSKAKHIHQWRLLSQLPVELIRQLAPDTPYEATL